jgi:tight adherence protein B
MNETFTIDTIMAAPIWIYATHFLTWTSILVIGLLFKEQFNKAIEIFTDIKGSATNSLERDRYIGIACGMTIFSVILLLDFNIFFALIAGFLVFLIVPIYIRRRRFTLFQKAFDASLVESLSTVSSSLRAGLTLKDALVVAANNCPPAFSSEVSRVLKDYRFGKSIDASLDGVRKRVQTPNTNIAFGALIIGTQLGGRIPEVLNRIVTTIRETDRVEGRLKALTAQGRAQGVLLCSMPILITIGLYLMDREKIEFMMTSPLGKVLIGIAVFLEIVGILVTAKVMKLDV